MESLKSTLEINRWSSKYRQEGTDKEESHHYISGFYELFFKQRMVTKIMEVGVRNGYSIRLWLSMPNIERIVGLDSDSRVLQSNLEIFDSRYFFHLADAYRLKSLNTLLKDENFDLIIDDGPHSLESQMFAARTFVKFLNDSGALVIEDVSKAEISTNKIINSLPLSFKGIVRVVDLRGISGKEDSVLIIISRDSKNGLWDLSSDSGRTFEIRRTFLRYCYSDLLLKFRRVKRFFQFTKAQFSNFLK